MTAAASRFDVVILGGGPAGTAAGLTLRKRDDIAVAIVEATGYQTPRIGESLSPGVRALLDYLDVWRAFRRQQPLEAFGSRAAWGSPEPGALDYLFTIHGTGWSLDRLRFDRMLADTFVERGGSLFTQTRFIATRRTADGWVVELSDAAESRREIRCRHLIEAQGRAGPLARRLGIARVGYDQLAGVGCLGTLPKDSVAEASVLVEACAYGWWYSAPVPGGQMSVVLMSDADIVSQKQAARPARWHALLAETKLTRERVRGVRFAGKPRSFLAHTSMLRQVGGTGWVAVGDAAASHDPLSSTGIPHALSSGIHGARVAANALFADGALLDEYHAAIERDFRQYLRTRWRTYRREARWRDSRFWKRRTTRIALDANARIARAEPAVGSRGAMHLPPRSSQQLLASCRPGREAHEIVRAFSLDHPQFSDERIILELQQLAAGGQITLDDRGRSRHTRRAAAASPEQVATSA